MSKNTKKAFGKYFALTDEIYTPANGKTWEDLAQTLKPDHNNGRDVMVEKNWQTFTIRVYGFYKRKRLGEKNQVFFIDEREREEQKLVMKF